MDNLRWLGLFSDETIGCSGDTSTAMMTQLLQRKLVLPQDQRDLVVLVHQLDVEYPENGREAQRFESTLVVKGEAGGFTAMSRTVGLPVAVIARMLLRGEISLTGCAIPHTPVHRRAGIARDRAGGSEIYGEEENYRFELEVKEC